MKEDPFKDGMLIMDLNTENGNDYEQVKSESRSLSVIQSLKKQFKRYQTLVGKMDDLCMRIVSFSPHLQIVGIHCATYLYSQNTHNKWSNRLHSRSAYLCLDKIELLWRKLPNLVHMFSTF